MTLTDNEIIEYAATAGNNFYLEIKLFQDSGSIEGNNYQLSID